MGMSLEMAPVLLESLKTMDTWRHIMWSSAPMTAMHSVAPRPRSRGLAVSSPTSLRCAARAAAAALLASCEPQEEVLKENNETPRRQAQVVSTGRRMSALGQLRMCTRRTTAVVEMI